MRFTEFISEAGSPKQQAAIAIAMKKAGKKPKNVAEGSNNDYQQGVDDGVEYFLYTDGEGDTIKDVFLQMKRSATEPKSEKYWRGVVDGMKSVQSEEQLRQGVAEGPQDDPEDYRAHLLKTLPRMMNFLSKNVKGWKPTEEQYLAAIETGYQVMKHTGDVQQAGRAMSDELNTLHRMSQSKSGMMEEWSQKYKSSINCSHPKGFSQKAHCAGKKKHNESIEMEMTCPDCGMCQTHGDNSKDKLDELKCWSGYHRVKGTTAGFPGSCAKNKTNEEQVDENLHKWFKEKWVRFGPDGKIRGDCARGSESEGKPKCLPQSKAHSLGKKGRASAAARKRREDPNANRSGKAINVSTKGKGK